MGVILLLNPHDSSNRREFVFGDVCFRERHNYTNRNEGQALVEEICYFYRN